MPNISYPLDDAYETVTRPVAFSVAKQLMRQLGYPDDAYLEFYGAIQEAKQKDSTLTTSTKNYFGTGTQADMRIREEPILDRVLETSPVRRDNIPYFKDEVTHVYMRPGYSPTNVTITFELKFDSQPEAQRWCDDILARVKMLRRELPFKVTYHHSIPKAFLVILSEIHRLIENVDQTGQTFGQYLREHFDPRMTVLSDMSGRGLVIVIPEDNVRVLGGFDFEAMPDEPTYDKDKNVWEVSFGYKYVYDKPLNSAMTYPLVIRQAVLDEQFRETQGDYKLDREDVMMGNSLHLLNHFADTFDRKYPSEWNAPIYLPEYDTWRATLVPGFTKDVVTLLVNITPDDRRYVVDLHELGRVSLTENMLAFIKDEREHVIVETGSLVEIGLYMNDGLMSPSKLTLTEDLKLYAVEDLPMEPVYHLRISILTDLSRLSNEGRERIRRNACKAYPILAWAFPHLVQTGLIPEPNMKRCVWNPLDWYEIIEVTRPKDNVVYDPSGNRLRNMLTVGFGEIITWRKDDASR